MTKKQRIAEVEASLTRLRYTLSQGDNAYGTYGRNCREAIERLESTLKELRS